MAPHTEEGREIQIGTCDCVPSYRSQIHEGILIGYHVPFPWSLTGRQWIVAGFSASDSWPTFHLGRWWFSSLDFMLNYHKALGVLGWCFNVQRAFRPILSGTIQGIQGNLVFLNAWAWGISALNDTNRDNCQISLFFQPRKQSHVWYVQWVGRRGKRISTEDIRGSSSICLFCLRWYPLVHVGLSQLHVIKHI